MNRLVKADMGVVLDHDHLTNLFQLVMTLPRLDDDDNLERNHDPSVSFVGDDPHEYRCRTASHKSLVSEDAVSHSLITISLCFARIASVDIPFCCWLSQIWMHRFFGWRY